MKLSLLSLLQTFIGLHIVCTLCILDVRLTDVRNVEIGTPTNRSIGYSRCAIYQYNYRQSISHHIDIPYASHTWLSNAVQRQVKTRNSPTLQYYMQPRIYCCFPITRLSLLPYLHVVGQPDSITALGSLYFRSNSPNSPCFPTWKVLYSGYSCPCSSLNNHHQHHSAAKC